jgi:hypothetical protein
MLDPRPIVMLDLNGVVHAYSKGWQNTAPLYDPPTDGFKEWASAAQGEFRIVVWPTHMNTPRDVRRIKKWFRLHNLDKLDLEIVPHPPRGLLVKIDDRALAFTGNWADYAPERLRHFKTWAGR